MGMVALLIGGRFLHLKLQVDDEGVGAVEGALFGLLGLIMAFTFGMAGSRYDTKRTVITEEANTIGTAFLRIDLYPNDSAKSILKGHFKQYIEARIKNHQAGFNSLDQQLTKDRSDSISQLIWNHVIQLAKVSENHLATMQMIPAINDVFDIVTTRESALKARVPDSIMWLLFLMILACSFLIGFSLPVKKKVNLISIIGFVVLSLLVVFVILDLDRPARGLINLSEQTNVMVDLRKMYLN